MKHLANTSNASVPNQHNNSFSELIRIQSAHLPGYNLALASSIRDGPIRNLAPSYVQLGRQTKQTNKHKRQDGNADAKILLVWGTKDRVVPYHYASRVLTLLGGEPAAHETFRADVGDEGEARQWAKTVQLPVLFQKEQDKHRQGQGHAALVTIEGAAHDLTASHPELIVELLVRLFGHDAPSSL